MIAPGLQLQWLVQFLRACLRADSALVSALNASPDMICRGALEVEPVAVEGGELAVYVTEFPSICAREMSADSVYAGPHHGMNASVRLWYVMKPPAGDTEPSLFDPTLPHPVPAMAMADRWMRNVYWRTLYWLRVHTLGDTDLFTSGQIYRMTLPTQVRFRRVGPVVMWEADMRMQYFLPPYAVADPADLLGIDYTLGDTNTPHEDGYVESEVDLT